MNDNINFDLPDGWDKLSYFQSLNPDPHQGQSAELYIDEGWMRVWVERDHNDDGILEGSLELQTGRGWSTAATWIVEDDTEEEDEEEENDAAESCYYADEKLCEGEIWECQTCREEFCDYHWHKTDLGVNVECVACERERLDAEEKSDDGPEGDPSFEGYPGTGLGYQ